MKIRPLTGQLSVFAQWESCTEEDEGWNSAIVLLTSPGPGPGPSCIPTKTFFYCSGHIYKAAANQRGKHFTNWAKPVHVNRDLTPNLKGSLKNQWQGTSLQRKRLPQRAKWHRAGPVWLLTLPCSDLKKSRSPPGLVWGLTGLQANGSYGSGSTGPIQSLLTGFTLRWADPVTTAADSTSQKHCLCCKTIIATH